MRQDYSSLRGEEFQITGQVLQNNVGYPSGSVTGFTLTFNVKRSKTDAAPLITRSTGPDVVLSVGGAYSVNIKAADTAAFTKTELLLWEAVLTEPTGAVTVVDRGTWKVLLR